jgi:hypothetical protein
VAWHGDSPGRTLFAYAFGAVLVYVLFSLLIAATTADDACAFPDSPKEWNIFPPRWECTGPAWTR